LSADGKDLKKRGKALHDATHGQFGDEPRAKPMPEKPDEEDVKRSEAARKVARDKPRTAT
jgi:hypothetical protein